MHEKPSRQLINQFNDSINYLINNHSEGIKVARIYVINNRTEDIVYTAPSVPPTSLWIR
jgi:hypothetical protein